MKYYTIVDAQNAIIKTVFVRDERLPLHVAAGQVAHMGKYDKMHFIFTGTEFQIIAQQPAIPLLMASSKVILNKLMRDLDTAGYVLPLQIENMNSKAKAKSLIDQAAGRARFRLVSPGTLIAEEYVLSEQEIRNWRAAGSPAGAVPTCILDWPDSAGMTAEQAAQDLELQAAQFKAVIFMIRNLRLKGKALVDNAVDYIPVADNYIAQLDSLLN
jgi:hypothetical protein